MSQTIERVRALIAKAESSPYPHEADAFMAKAQQLIDEHAIDQAVLRGADPKTIGHEQIPMRGTYTRERALIWGAVARANRCQVLTLSPYRSAKVSDITLVGREHDRAAVRLVAASLELQAMRRMADLAAPVFETAVVQRRSFLRGFATEVADRLRGASTTTPATVNAAAAKALVLAADAVDGYVDENFDVRAGRRSQVRFDGAAYSHGRRVGATADVGSSRLGAERAALPPA